MIVLISAGGSLCTFHHCLPQTYTIMRTFMSINNSNISSYLEKRADFIKVK